MKAYENALDLQLDHEFIRLIEDEIKRRIILSKDTGFTNELKLKKNQRD